jgi:hypothetical protein
VTTTEDFAGDLTPTVAPMGGALEPTPLSEFSATGLVIRPGVAFADWQHLGKTLTQMQGGILWWLDDWLNYGERSYGEMYAQALDATDYSYQTLAHAKSIASKLDLCRRRQNLSFAHHAEIASLTPAAQDRWLDQAESKGWTRAQLRAARRQAKIAASPVAGEPGTTLNDLVVALDRVASATDRRAYRPLAGAPAGVRVRRPERGSCFPRGDPTSVRARTRGRGAAAMTTPRLAADRPGVTTVPSPMCVDLQALYGTRLKLRREADGVTWSTTPEPERIWLLEIPCKHGVVYPTGGDGLAAVVTGRRIGHQIAALPGIRSSRGDIERVVTFGIDDAEPVLALLKPHRRRQISPGERERLVALGRLHGAVGLARAHQQRRHGHSDLSKPLENDPRIDAAAETDLAPIPERPDAGNRAGDGQPRSRRAARGRLS